jgi:peroxiredoxin
MKARIAIVLLVAFTIFITWKAKLLEKNALGRATLALVNKPAPEFQLTSLDGRAVSLADYRGKKKLVVSFWASWCGPCRMELPALRKFYEQNRKNGEEFEVLAISIDEDIEAAQSYATKTKLSFPVLLDSDHKTANAYSVEGIPVLYVIDKDGKVIYGHEGFEPYMEVRLSSELGLNKKKAQGDSAVAADGGTVRITVSAGDNSQSGGNSQKDSDAQPGH